MAAMAMEVTGRVKRRTNRPRRKNNGSRLRSGLRALVAGDHQLVGVHHLRVQLCQTPIVARLAFLWRILGFSGCAVYRDVWLSADDLLVIGLAVNALSRHRLDVARLGPPARNDFRLEDKSSFRTLSYHQQHSDRRGLLAACLGVEGVICGAAPSQACDYRTLRARAAPPVRGLHSDHDRVFISVADPGHARDVPDPGHDV